MDLEDLIEGGGVSFLTFIILVELLRRELKDLLLEELIEKFVFINYLINK